jgi:hypothetical protein
MKNFYKATLEHTPLVSYNEKYPLFPIMSVLSFMSPTHAQIYNNLVNHQHWFSSDSSAQLSIMQVCTPKTKFNYNTLFKNYVKKPPKEKTPDTTKPENWLMKIYDVPRRVAKQYLMVEGVMEEVRSRLK